MENNEIKILEGENYTFGAGANTFAFMNTGIWCQTDTDAPKSYDTQITVCNNGEFVPESIAKFNEKIDYTANYESKTNDEITLSATVGTGDISIDGISISTKAGAKASASVKAHAHGTGTHQARSRTIAIPAFDGWGASLFGMEIGVDESCIQSSSYDVSLSHKDQGDNVGGHKIGITHGETHTAKFDYISDSEPTDVSGWTMTNTQDSPKLTRDGFCAGSVTYIKYVAVAT